MILILMTGLCAGCGKEGVKNNNTGMRTSQISMVCDWLVRLAGIEDGKVDDQEQANAEEGRIGGHVAGLQAAQQGAYGGGQPRQSANDEAGDDELVHKVDDGGQNALDSPDQHFIIEQINIKAVGESPGNGIAGEFVRSRGSCVEGSRQQDSGKEGCQV